MGRQSDIATRGRKRPAEGEVDDQPLAKRFGNLQIGNATGKNFSREQQTERIPKPCKTHDAMMLDDTKHTVYIHDLESELAETNTFDGTLTILPGLEKKLSLANIPVPENKRPCNEIVLYREPESLSIPKDEDQVRRALIETRERARLRQRDTHGSIYLGNKYQFITDNRGDGGESGPLSNLEDGMDIDNEF